MSSYQATLHDAAEHPRHIPISLIERASDQARQHFDATALDELADSISQIGIMQPVVVRPIDNGRYRLIAGERRWRAAQLAGLATLPASVRDDLDEAETASFGLVENLQRESLGVMDTAFGLNRLAHEYGLTHETIAHRIGKSRVFVTNFLRLTQLTRDVQQWLNTDDLSLGHAKILVGLTPARQRQLGAQAVHEAWSVRQLETAANTEQQPASNEQSSAEANELADLERGLSAELGNQARVSYQSTTGRGELRIQFNSLDEFDGLLQRLGYRGA